MVFNISHRINSFTLSCQLQIKAALVTIVALLMHISVITAHAMATETLLGLEFTRFKLINDNDNRKRPEI